jgi:hypothetical protein
VLALQYHPEFGHAFMVDLLDAFGLKLPPEALALGRAQVACESGPPVDAPLVWQWIAQFFDQSFQP